MSAIEDICEVGKLKIDEAGDFDKSLCSMATTKSEVYTSIKKAGYSGALLNENEFTKALTEGPKSVEYTQLVSFLTNQIGILRNLDECVNPISSPEDSSTFIMEISSFLNELGCPYSWIMQGHVSDRFCSEQDRLLLLEYLSMEVLMARIHREHNPVKKIELNLHESSQAADLRKILQIFGFVKPPPNVTMLLLMQKLIPTIKTAIQKAGPELLGHPILNATLTAKKWEMLNDIQKELHTDFRIRREMLLKRLDCTIQSFQWSNKTKGKEDTVNKLCNENKKEMKPEPDIDISDLLAARDDLAIIEKTSSASVRKNTKSSINSVIIGQVPDRGGRTSEQAPPPPEMPSWQQRNTGPASGGGFRGGRGGNSSFSRGGGQQNSFGSANPYSKPISTFSSTGNSFGRDNSYNKGGDTFRNDSNPTRGSFDSAGSYGRSDNNYSQGRGNFDTRSGGSYSAGGSFSSSRDGGYSSRDSSFSSNSGGNYSSQSGKGGFSSNSGGNYSTQSGRDSFSSNSGGNYSSQSGKGSSSYSGGNYSSQSGKGGSSNSGGNYSSQSGKGAFDSAGSYGGYSQEPKRPKTFDQYQPNKTTYADQYVEESSRNQQYHARSDNRNSTSGRSNYSRGGGSSSYR